MNRDLFQTKNANIAQSVWYYDSEIIIDIKKYSMFIFFIFMCILFDWIDLMYKREIYIYINAYILTQKHPVYVIKLNLVVRLQFLSSGECSVLLYCYYSQVNSDMDDGSFTYVLKLFMLDRNTLNHITVCKQIVVDKKMQFLKR